MTTLTPTIGLLGGAIFIFAMAASVREWILRHPRPYCSNCGLVVVKRARIFCKLCERQLEK